MQDNFEEFYRQRIKDFGPTAQGVGWKSDDAQQVRFSQLIKIIDGDHSFTINDLGCGTGDLVTFLQTRNFEFYYQGYDVMQEMVKLARKKSSQQVNISFSRISSARDMRTSDYTVASGIFNIHFNARKEDWLKYILETVDIMNEKSVKGFAFNMLTKYSDAEYMKQELYYGDPCLFFDYCKRNFSKNIALLHDYDQYDFTILVRKR